MAIFNVDYQSLGVNMTPPDKRSPILLGLIQSLVYPLKWLSDKWYIYRTGLGITTWSNSTAYIVGDRVAYNYVVYECVQSNTNQIPINNTSYWSQILNDFIGADERILYNGKCMQLTWALNKKFGGTFTQPASSTSAWTNSTLYISRNTPTNNSLVVYTSDIGQSVYTNHSDGSVVNSSYINTPTYNYSVNLPTAMYASVGEKALRNFIDNYNILGTTYNFVTY